MGAAPEDYYVLLGVDDTADDEDIRRAWRVLALQWHPDRAGEAANIQPSARLPGMMRPVSFRVRLPA